MHITFDDLYTRELGKGQLLNAYKCGVITGFKKGLDSVEIVVTDRNTDAYTDGLMVGIGMESPAEYDAEMAKIDSKLRTMGLKQLMELYGGGVGADKTLELGDIIKDFDVYNESDAEMTRDIYDIESTNMEEENA